MTESVVQAFLFFCSGEKCCGGENDTVQFRSGSQTMMAALLFALKYKHTHTHVMTPAPLVWCLPECEITHTHTSGPVLVCVVTPQVVFLTKRTMSAMTGCKRNKTLRYTTAALFYCMDKDEFLAETTSAKVTIGLITQQ